MVLPDSWRVYFSHGGIGIDLLKYNNKQIMKEEKLGQEPVFPLKMNQVIGQTSFNFFDENGNEQIGHYNNYADISYQGASKRFYAACAAMQGILANSQFMTDCKCSPKAIIEYSYEFADELLRQEKL